MTNGRDLKPRRLGSVAQAMAKTTQSELTNNLSIHESFRSELIQIEARVCYDA